jgi:hypothetical protein
MIDESAAQDLLALPDALERPQRTNFRRASDALLRGLLEGDAERRARRRE